MAHNACGQNSPSCGYFVQHVEYLLILVFLDKKLPSIPFRSRRRLTSTGLLLELSLTERAERRYCHSLVPHHGEDLALQIAIRGAPLSLVDAERRKSMVASVCWLSVSSQPSP